MTAHLTASALFEGCRSARRLGIATGERLGPTAPEQIWPALRDTLGLPSRLDPDQERELFEAFAAAHRSSGAMRAAPRVGEGQALDNRATQVLSSSRLVLPSVSWSTTEDDPVVTPMTALGALVQSVRRWLSPKQSAERVAIREALAALLHEVQRHRHRVESIAAQLERARGRR